MCPLPSVLRVPQQDTLQFVLARYTLNGTLVGFEPLRKQFMYCNEGESRSTDVPDWLQYGFGVDESFTCDLRTLLTRSTGSNGNDLSGLRTIDMFDLYLVDGGTPVLPHTCSFRFELKPCPRGCVMQRTQRMTR
jgi:hypothetical protein